MTQLPLGAETPPVAVRDGLHMVVHGIPAPQGSKRAFVNKHTGRVNMVESSKAVRPWRESVKAAALDARTDTDHATYQGPVTVIIRFLLQRPKGHYGTGRNAHIVRPSAPPYPATRPDLDKLTRSTLDALKEAGVYRDDGQIVTLQVEKLYGEPGASISVSTMGG